jgi:hypothetical protein
LAPNNGNLFKETGITGLRRAGGYVQEEFLPQLAGYRAIQVFREMKDNDPVVGAILYAIDKLVRQVPWRVQPASTRLEDQRAAKFLESCLYDMSTSWEDTISEIMSMLAFGWSIHEIVYKKRNGQNRDSTKNSKYDDGAIGWRKLPIRAQETRQEWVFDDRGGIQGMYQSAPPDYTLVLLPIEKSLLFRTTTAKNNPEGRSVLRNAYRSWYFKRRIEEIEAIGVERDLAGFPIMYVDPDIMRADAPGWKQTIFNDYKEAVVNIRRDQQEGLVLPAIYDDNNNQLYRLELLSAGGGRQFDTNTIITRYDQRIATTVLADFILLGQANHGSYALSSDKTNLFALSIRTWLEIIKTVMNQHAVARLFSVNGFKVRRLPELTYGEIETPPLTEIGTFIQQLAGAGAPLFPDGALENHLRKMANLPEKREEAMGEVADAGKDQQPQPPKQPAQPEEPKETDEQVVQSMTEK